MNLNNQITFGFYIRKIIKLYFLNIRLMNQIKKTITYNLIMSATHSILLANFK